MRLAAILGIALICAPSVGFAQLEPYKGPPLEGRPPKEELGSLPPGAPKPTPDPRDLNGMYQQLEENGPDPSFDVDIATQCRPSIEIGARAYAQMIVQTPGRITLVEEFNRVTRRVRLDAALPPSLTPTYAGYSVGRWEGDTLVVTTRGLRDANVAGDPRVVAVDEVVERFTKQPDGQIDVRAVVSGKDAQGRPRTAQRRATLAWRPDLRLMEYICEDGAR